MTHRLWVTDRFDTYILKAQILEPQRLFLQQQHQQLFQYEFSACNIW